MRAQRIVLSIIMVLFLIIGGFVSSVWAGGESGKELAEEFVEEFKSLFEFKSNAFRGIDWGTSIEECPGMVLVESQNRTKLYMKGGGSLFIRDVELAAKSYMFFDNQLMAIIIETKGEGNFETLKRIAFEEFESWIQPDESVPGWLCLDFFGKTMRELEYQRSLQKGILRLISIKIYNKFKESRESVPKAESEPEWSCVISWKGNGAKTTESFRVKKSWRIKWKNLGDILQIYVHNLDGDFVALPVNTLEKGEDVSYIYETGEFYLTINALGRWEVRIEEKT